MIKGKGFFIWKIPECENGDVQKIASTTHQAGLTHVLVKIANGIYDYNYDPGTKKDLVAPLAAELEKYNIQTWGWHYVFGNLPFEEARAAIRQINKLPLTGYIIDAEGEYKHKNASAITFMNHIRDAFPDYPIGLSSYRFPRYHMEFPWTEFLSQCNFNMPQVYWEQAQNPGEQLAQSHSEFQTLISPIRPYIPTGAAYAVSGWTATSADITEFLNKVAELGFQGTNFWSWDYCRSKLPNLWNTVSNFNWPQPPTSQFSLPVVLINAMNQKDLAAIINLYQPNAVHINSRRTIQGHAAIQSWYSELITDSLMDGFLQLVSYDDNEPTVKFTWKIIFSNNEQFIYSDTISLEGNKIIYHYSTYFN